MSTTWILIANAAQAKVYANLGPNKGVELVNEYAHPESREKGSELVSDRPGHNQGHGNGRGAYVPQTGPKQNAAEHFALAIEFALDAVFDFALQSARPTRWRSGKSPSPFPAAPGGLPPERTDA